MPFQVPQVSSLRSGHKIGASRAEGSKKMIALTLHAADASSIPSATDVL